MPPARPPRAIPTWRDDPARVRPMLATALDGPSDIDLVDPALLYEPKLDGIRALIALEPAQPSPRVTIWSRNGNDKTHQFPEVVRGLKDFAKRLRVPILLDGEIVALNADGEPTTFQRLQGRMHLMGARDIARQADAQAAAFVAFDILRDGAEDLRPLPLTDRRARLERIFGASGSSTVRLGDFVASDGRRLHQQAVARGWEGLIVKVADSPYESGRRSRAWRKLKLVKQQEFVIGGWTEPRESRMYFGALLLGAYERDPSPDADRRAASDRRGAAGGRHGAAGGGRGTASASARPDARRLRYRGHSGTGFSHQELGRLFTLLQARATDVCPFVERPASNERPHWVRPELVCQVKFSEWTDEGILRHPVYLGLRDDVDPWQVIVEPQSGPIGTLEDGPSVGSRAGESRPAHARRSGEHARTGDEAHAEPRAPALAGDTGGTGGKVARAARPPAAAAARVPTRSRGSRTSRSTDASATSGAARGTTAGARGGRAAGSAASPKEPGRGRGRGRLAATAADERALLQVVDRLNALQDARRDGTLALPDGTSIDVTNLAKVFWPTEKLTKGDLLRFYVRISPWLLPAVEDRPLVMKRFPNGVAAKAFYQQRAPDDPPPGVRVELFEDEDEPSGTMPRLVGGSLATLLYMAQLAAISQDPWFSRVQSPDLADYVALDLDPMPGVPFSQVLDVARFVHEELEALDIPSVPKTSGASGLHVYIPLPPDTTYESGQLLCHIVATMVAMKHGRISTVERAVAKRGRKVYVDYLQNIEGKTLATAYSARASEFAGVSTPLTWDEVHDGVEPQDFTLRTALARFEQRGDLWAPIRTARPVDLRSTLARLAANGSS